MSDKKERCKYWEKCYRKNTQHTSEYLHPSDLCSPTSPINRPLSNSITNIQKARGGDLKPSSSKSHLPSKTTLALTPSSSKSHLPSKTTLALTPSSSKSHLPSTVPSNTPQSVVSKQVPQSDSSLPKTQTKDVISKERITSLGKSDAPVTMKRPLKPDGDINRKRRKLKASLRHDRYYFTKVVGHPAKFSDDIAVSFRDILSLDGKLVKTWQFTYMADLDWLLEEYPDNASEGPIFLFLGEKQAQAAQEQIMMSKKSTTECTKYSRVIIVPVPLPLSYGTHHTKLMLLQSEAGIRVVVHTANLVRCDWTVKAQGVWISPLCPLMSSVKDGDTEDTECLAFKPYLLKYLKAYTTPATEQLCRILSKYDMSHVTDVKLVGSVPGMHTSNLFGKLRLKSLLALYVDGTKVRPGWRLTANCSSIGTLGASQSDWLDAFIRALQTTNATGVSRDKTPERQCLFQLVFPTVEMIRNSLEGYCGGGSVPYQLQTHRRQPWLRDVMCQWESSYGRSRVVPHIKTYTRISPDMKRLAWMLLTSANLSKAAWGAVVGGGQLRVRSYELGVLFVDKDVLSVYNPAQESGVMVPYCLPPKPYSKTDKPWIADVSYSQLDTHGNKWPVELDGTSLIL